MSRSRGLLSGLERPQDVPLRAALDAELVRLERAIALAGQLLAGTGLVISLVLAFTSTRALGVGMAVFSATLVGWFTLVRVLLGQGVATRALRWASPLVEISLPTVLLLIDLQAQGPLYALGISVPLQFYGIFVALQVLRLQRWLPLVVGAVGAAQYALVALLVLRPQLSPALVAEAAFTPQFILVRAGIVLLAGAASTLVSLVLRRAVGAAAGETRSRELFGKYRLEQELASGGMGVVFRARYSPEGGFERPVALKRIHPHLAKVDSFVAAFRNEAELSSRLLHPNIVQVLDFGRIEDTYFLAMEFVDGFTLGELITRCRRAGKPIPTKVIVAIGEAMLEGLYFAHRLATSVEGEPLRIVHRDLNPPNVLLSRSGEVKVSDFGIARALGTNRQLHTQTIAGKAAYMAPEQARAEALDERADLFAVGLILWELLTQSALFHRESDAASLVAILHEEAPALSKHRADAGTWWDAFFVEALAKEPGRRFPHAVAMREALASIVRDDPPARDELRRFLATLPDAVIPGSLSDDRTVPGLPLAG